ncbi:MAG: MFS transporter [Anaerolineae bacterium]|nr:MFS transporter [Anaerolineae bacterium]
MGHSLLSFVGAESLAHQDSEGEASGNRNALAIILLMNFLLSLGFSTWQVLFSNFAVAEIGLGAAKIGLLQSVREIPGLLGVGVGVLALLLAEMRIAGLALILTGVGLALTGSVGAFPAFIAASLVMSVGFHFFVSSNQSAAMMAVDERDAPRVLGSLSSVGAMGSLVGAGVVLVFLNLVGFRSLFYGVGALLVLSGLVLAPWWGRRTIRRERRRERLAIRKRYWLYYVLQFLMGSRRHIFTTFAVFLLVKEHNVAAQTITLLFVLNSLLGTLLYRQFGRIVARFGERQVLAVNFILLIPVFLGYAYISYLPMLCAIFVADHLLFGFSIAIESYLQKIAVSPEEITSNVALGQTINHIAAVVVPLVGGIVWEQVGGRFTFLMGVAIAVACLVLVQWMRGREVYPSRV